MRLEGISYSIKNGKKMTTLHGTDEFEGYYKPEDGTRGCVGRKAESFYVGDYDCSHLKVGQEIEIYFDRAKVTASGKTFQTIKKIEVVK